MFEDFTVKKWGRFVPRPMIPRSVRQVSVYRGSLLTKNNICTSRFYEILTDGFTQ